MEYLNGIDSEIFFNKEYNFLNAIADDIAKKTTKIYEKQIRKNKVLPYHCDYRKLEEALEKYKRIIRK